MHCASSRFNGRGSPSTTRSRPGTAGRPGTSGTTEPRRHTCARVDWSRRGALVSRLALRRRVRRRGRVVRRWRPWQVRRQCRAVGGATALGARARRATRTAATPHHRPRTTLLAECRWELEWMLRMQVPAGKPLAGTAFHRVHGTEWTPIPMWPHEDPTERVLHRPSTAATLNLAAAAAHGARVFADVDAAYSARLLGAARVAYLAARSIRRLFAPDDHGAFGGGPYNDDELDDEFYWAAVEMFLATDEQPFLDDIERSPCHHADVFEPNGFDWDRVAVPPASTSPRSTAGFTDRTRVQQSVISGADRIIEIQRTQPWAPALCAGRWLGLGFERSDPQQPGRARNRVRPHRATATISMPPLTGIDYLFGRNALGQSYVTGYGTDHTSSSTHPPLRPRPRPRVPASAPRRDRRRPELQDVPRLPLRRSARGAAAPAAATSTSPPRRPPTTSASGGTRRSSGSPTFLADAQRLRIEVHACQHSRTPASYASSRGTRRIPRVGDCARLRRRSVQPA